MRTDKQTSLRQRLRRGADAFDFDALINGVSTLEEDLIRPEEANRIAAPAEQPALAVNLTEVSQDPSAQDTVLEQDTLPYSSRTKDTTVAQAKAPNPALESAFLNNIATETHVAEIEAEAAVVAAPEPVTDNTAAVGVKIASPPPSVSREERLRAAIDSLGRRLLPEVHKLQGAMQEGNAVDAGYYLSHVNQLLELLRSIDPGGDQARTLGAGNAPPVGKPWPSPAWSVVEFAESPFSALLPSNRDIFFVREMMYCSWENG